METSKNRSWFGFFKDSSPDFLTEFQGVPFKHVTNASLSSPHVEMGTYRNKDVHVGIEHGLRDQATNEMPLVTDAFGTRLFNPAIVKRLADLKTSIFPITRKV